MLVSYSELCEQVVALDASIRFAGVANKLGKIVASAYRSGLVPLLSKEETERTIPQYALRLSPPPELESKLGRPVYSVTTYEKIRRAIIPLHDVYGNTRSLLLVSFDIEERNYDSLIQDRILPLVRGNDDSHMSDRRYYQG
ncbi:MAG TPA: hypothetical protein VF172_02320 [Nitrososphaera sp.]|jgi:hypothetical protein